MTEKTVPTITKAELLLLGNVANRDIHRDQDRIDALLDSLSSRFFGKKFAVLLAEKKLEKPDPKRLVRCRFCTWTKQLWATDKSKRKHNAFDDLSKHVKHDHPDQYKRIVDRSVAEMHRGLPRA